MTGGPFAALGRFAVRFRWPILLAWLVAAGLAVLLLPSIASVSQSDNTGFLPSSAPSVRASALATPLLGRADVTSFPLVVAGRRPLDAADLLAIDALARRVARLPEVIGVHDLGLSPDGEAEQLGVVSSLAPGNQPRIVALVEAVTRQAHAAGLPAGLTAEPAGTVAVSVADAKASAHTGSIVQLLSVLVILALLFSVFRAVLAPLLTLLPPLLVVTFAGPVVAELSVRTGLQVSEISQLLLIVLVLGAGTDYGLFLVFREREELRTGSTPHQAIVAAMSRVGESITFSAGTVIAALLSLLIATFGVYRDLGIPLAIGVTLMLLAGLTLLPALLAIFGHAVFWPARPARQTPAAGLWGRTAARAVTRPKRTLALGLVIFGGLALAIVGNKPAGFGGTLAAPAGSPAAIGDTLLAEHFPQVSADPTNLVLRFPAPVFTDPEVLARTGVLLRATGEFTTLAGPLSRLSGPELTALHAALGPAQRLPALEPATLASRVPPSRYQAYRATAAFIGPGGHTVQFEAGLAAGSPAGTPAIQAVPAIRADLARIGHDVGATDVGVAGEAPGLADVNHLSDSDLFRVIPVAVLVIALLLALVLRSLVAPLYLIASVALSYLAALGLSVLVFIDLGGAGGITFVLPFLLFIFLLALGEDYNILVMSRIREEAHHRPLREAVTRAIGSTGGTVTSAGLVLAGTFLVLGFSGGGGDGSAQIRDVGFGLAFGILMDTFLVRTLLVPSLVALLGWANWWPSRLATAAGPGAAGHSKRARGVDRGARSPGRCRLPQPRQAPGVSSGPAAERPEPAGGGPAVGGFTQGGEPGAGAD